MKSPSGEIIREFACAGTEFLTVDKEIIKLCKSGAFMEFPSSRFFEQCTADILAKEVAFCF